MFWTPRTGLSFPREPNKLPEVAVRARGSVYEPSPLLPIWLHSLLTILGNCEAQSSLNLTVLLSGCILNAWQGQSNQSWRLWSDYGGLECQSREFRVFSVDTMVLIKVLNRVCFRDINLAFVSKIKQREKTRLDAIRVDQVMDNPGL